MTQSLQYTPHTPAHRDAEAEGESLTPTNTTSVYPQFEALPTTLLSISAYIEL